MNTLGCTINIIANKLKRQIEKNNQAFGISAIQGRIIQYIKRKSKNKDVFQKDLENEFELRGASLSSTLQNLEYQGLIIREPLSSDQRLKRIVLTKKALEISLKPYYDKYKDKYGKCLLNNLEDSELMLLIKRLAETFHVSPILMIYRLKNLNLLQNNDMKEVITLWQ